MVGSTIQQCCKIELRRLQPGYYTAQGGLDAAGLAEAVLVAVKTQHAEVLRQSQDRMLRTMISSLLRELHHKSRPRTTPQGATVVTAAMLPGFAEIAEEYYTDDEQRRWRLLDMSLERLRNAVIYYRHQEQSYHERAARLQRFADAMQARGLGLQATVRELYA